MNNLKLNPDSKEELQCKNLNGLKRCIVSLEHFNGKKTDYYYLHHSNHLNGISIDLSSNPLYVNIPPENFVLIRIKLEDNKDIIQIGKNGFLYLITNYNDNERNVFNESDIEEKISFNSYIYSKYNSKHSANCRLWNPKNDKLRVFCKLNNLFYFSEGEITLETIQFDYQNYTIFIVSNDYFKVRQLSYNMPFLYSEKLKINIEEGIESYQFLFKYELYEKEILYINQGISYVVLDNCSIKNKEVVCKISKDKLEENLILSEGAGFKLWSFHDYLGTIYFNSVIDITINYALTKKKDIFIQVTKLLNKVSESGASVAYETNITSIPNLKTNIFQLEFFDLLNEEYTNGSCLFKKNSKDTMILLCNIIGSGYFYILETENNIILNDINYKYNFVLLPIEIFDIIRIAGYGTEIYLTYPSILNFVEKEEFNVK